MKLTEKIKGFFLGVLVTIIISTVITPALAATIEKTITIYAGVDIYVDDVIMNPTDVNGNPVDVFTYNGTTYLPVRAISNVFAKEIEWAGDSRSVYLGKHTDDANNTISKMYIEFPFVPDFRAYSGIDLHSKVDTVYGYSATGKTIDVLNGYYDLLVLNGFSYERTTLDDYGYLSKGTELFGILDTNEYSEIWIIPPQ